MVDKLPSSQTAPALGSLVSGVSSVAFVGDTLYGLLAGAGCSHGVPTVPNGVLRVGPTGMTIGPDGALYVSENGFGFPAGAGRVVRITVH